MGKLFYKMNDSGNPNFLICLQMNFEGNYFSSLADHVVFKAGVLERNRFFFISALFYQQQLNFIHFGVVIIRPKEQNSTMLSD